mmetsp:Transcript_90890/g.294071  ORF Transcript_90890/g.294071 Transcript_90890/m.294071 type:complete len:529 (+) Transcript_90890:132-1718(+)
MCAAVIVANVEAVPSGAKQKDLLGTMPLQPDLPPSLLLFPPTPKASVTEAAVAAYHADLERRKAEYHRMSSLRSVATTASGGRQASEKECDSENESSSGRAGSGLAVLSDPGAESDVAELAALAEQVPLGSLPSHGSVLHAEGKCSRCCFHMKNRCRNGANCQFCHLKHERRTRGRGCRGHGTGGRMELRGTPEHLKDEVPLPLPPGLSTSVAAARARPEVPVPRPPCVLKSMLATQPAMQSRAVALSEHSDAATRSVGKMMLAGGVGIGTRDATARAPPPLRGSPYCLPGGHAILPSQPEGSLGLLCRPDFGHGLLSPAAATAMTAGEPREGPVPTPNNVCRNTALLSTPAPAHPSLSTEAAGYIQAHPRDVGPSTHAVGAVSTGAHSVQEFCASTKAVGGSPVSARTIFGTAPTRGGQAPVFGPGTKCLALVSPQTASAASPSTSTTVAALAQDTAKQPKPIWDGEEVTEPMQLLQSQDELKSFVTPPHMDFWTKPLKVILSSYECEVPTLDPQVPVKKRSPDWSA